MGATVRQATLDALRVVASALVRLRQPDGIAGLRSLAVSGFAALGPLLAGEASKNSSDSVVPQWRPADFDWLGGLELQVREICLSEVQSTGIWCVLPVLRLNNFVRKCILPMCQKAVPNAGASSKPSPSLDKPWKRYVPQF